MNGAHDRCRTLRDGVKMIPVYMDFLSCPHLPYFISLFAATKLRPDSVILVRSCLTNGVNDPFSMWCFGLKYPTICKYHNFEISHCLTSLLGPSSCLFALSAQPPCSRQQVLNELLLDHLSAFLPTHHPRLTTKTRLYIS